jgi:hypothetical protein
MRRQLPSLINKEYLMSIKQRLNKTQNNYSFDILSFCKQNIIFLFIIAFVLIACLWRYNLKCKGELNNTRQKINEIQRKSALSKKEHLASIKKKNDKLNKPRFAIADDARKLTKLEHLPKQKIKPENNITELPNLLPANSEVQFGANF